ncbi:Uncharacterised protein [Mycobacteroides abscessus subsp. abscessus]|nr:Uncharacterised protein [Mycobacteroides abscessus subsp. abscessus]SHR28080.1 Uncharacterised protein [Mycobacteroides abscessus subsp. abscessus]SHR94699.1 Uncharacterised protein [Mycobacteroides abscessus subsp. abscessus]SHS73680.1 Uncharacterised protein [Mycobacteroides abscessus subsp. abscessus]SHT30364.1 Uncharacterised protein [Mycobacteroides abscessus subsp. abscessus]
MFDLETGPSAPDGRPIVDSERRGRVALDLGSGSKPRFVHVSQSTTWAVAKPVIGSLMNGPYLGPNIPPDFRDSAADLDRIVKQLQTAGLV